MIISSLGSRFKNTKDLKTVLLLILCCISLATGQTPLGKKKLWHWHILRKHSVRKGHEDVLINVILLAINPAKKYPLWTFLYKNANCVSVMVCYRPTIIQCNLYGCNILFRFIGAMIVVQSERSVHRHAVIPLFRFSQQSFWPDAKHE